VLTWGGMALAAYPGGFPLSEAQMAVAGALVYVAMLIGPAGAACLLIGLLDGRSGFRELAIRLTRWRVGVRWIAVALLAPPLLIMTLLFGLSLVSPAFQPAIFTADNKLAVVLTAVATGLAVGFFEELGWTGFAVPRLRQRYGLLTTGLIVGGVWGVWHLPPFWTDETFAAVLPFALLLGQLFSWLPPYRVLMVWIYGRTDSLLVAILMHAALVASLSALVPAELTTTALLTWILTWAAALWLIVATMAVAKRKRFVQAPPQKQLAGR
ncbi:MAG: CPBP family intramembrane metalloprotease, partial [Anaerolineales bacterium]|nr:CPBP family intramembrane metalloprotease [Anaerolineales bacterium]